MEPTAKDLISASFEQNDGRRIGMAQRKRQERTAVGVIFPCASGSLNPRSQKGKWPAKLLSPTTLDTIF